MVKDTNAKVDNKEGNFSKKITMQDVAKYAGVSYQTVSRVLNTPEKVAPDTRVRIEQAIADLKYVPNLLARQLGMSERKVIGFLNISRSLRIPATLMSDLQSMADKMEYKVFISLIEDVSYESVKNCISDLNSQMVYKILINAPVISSIAEQLVKDFPESKLIFLDVDPFCPVLNVSFNPYDGTVSSIKYLSSLGHKKVVLICGPEGNISSDLRYRAWITGLENQNMEIVYSQSGDWSTLSGYNVMTSILSHTRDFTAVISANDEMALGAIAALNRNGIQVPKDVSIVGYDNLEEGAFFNPPLTSIALDQKQQIEIAFKKLFSDDNTSVVLSTNLVIRQSCAKAITKDDISPKKIAAHLREIAAIIEHLEE